jgi:hypothetical protein
MERLINHHDFNAGSSTTQTLSRIRVWPRRAGASHRPESAPDCPPRRRAGTESTGSRSVGPVRRTPPETFGRTGRAIIRRNPHLGQQCTRAPACWDQFDQPRQIVAHRHRAVGRAIHRWRPVPESTMAGRYSRASAAGKPAQAAAGGVAADAGVRPLGAESRAPPAGVAAG